MEALFAVLAGAWAVVWDAICVGGLAAAMSWPWAGAAGGCAGEVAREAGWAASRLAATDDCSGAVEAGESDERIASVSLGPAGFGAGVETEGCGVLVLSWPAASTVGSPGLDETEAAYRPPKMAEMATIPM